MKTFNDYAEEVPVQFMKFTLPEGHPWVGQAVSDIVVPPDSIFVLLMRKGERIVPDGSTVLTVGDTLVLSGKTADGVGSASLYERRINDSDEWNGKPLFDITADLLIIMIKRKEEVVIPKGDTVIKSGDILVMTDK